MKSLLQKLDKPDWIITLVVAWIVVAAIYYLSTSRYSQSHMESSVTPADIADCQETWYSC